tara:strand:- start:6290 stop:6550 length:261 start_codon:yes stop_codon:yes gene_type:complete
MIDNKYNWKFTFTYHSNFWGSTLLTYTGKKGINHALSIANGNMNWDAADNLMLHKRKRIGSVNDSDINKVERYDLKKRFPEKYFEC